MNGNLEKKDYKINTKQVAKITNGYYNKSTIIGWTICRKGGDRMKFLAILLMVFGIISNSVVIVAAEEANVEKIEMTAAQVGEVEDISHPFLFAPQLLMARHL